MNGALTLFIFKFSLLYFSYGPVVYLLKGVYLMSWPQILKRCFLVFLFSSSVAIADDNQPVSEWTQAALLDTLSASYADTPADIAEVEQYFLPAAWHPMISFLRDKRVIVNEQELVLHPRALNAATITDNGYCDQSRCWTVSQSIAIPELRLNLDIAAVVIASTGKTPYLIQSLNMNLRSD